MVKESFIVDSECDGEYFFTFLMMLNNMTTTLLNDVMHLIDWTHQPYKK